MKKDENVDDNLLNQKISQYYSLEKENNRILLIGHTGNNSGGAELLLVDMIREFIRQDVEVVVFVKSDGPIIKTYKSIAPTFVIDDDFKLELYLRQLSKYGFKTAILNTVISGNFLPVLKKYGFFTIHLVHELPGTIQHLNAGNLAKLIGNYADLVVFPSDYVAKNFESITKVKNEIIQPQGLYRTYNNFNKKLSRQKLEKRYGISNDMNIVLSVGRAELRKGCDLFIESYKRLKNENYVFIWLGVIDNEMKSEEFFDVIKEKNLIFPGFVSDVDELMTFYDACDIFLLTSREDPFPSVVLEAFNARKPVIGFKDAGGFQDIVIDDVSGYLVKFESVEELVDKIEFLCKNKELKEELGNNAKKISEEYKFDRYIEILKSNCIFSLKGQKNNSLFKKLKIFLINTIKN